MTGGQIEEAKKTLPLLFNDMTPEQRQLRKELSCRNMINCCLIYGIAKFGFYDPKTLQFGKYALSHVKSLGEETVLRLYNEQVKDFSEAIVTYGVYTDSEGCTYNSCKWKDEQ